MTSALPFDVETELGRLKGFQRAAVDHAFHRLYDAEDSTRRFLLADEVGLGKTLIARGIVARAIERLWTSVDRIDVIYICSHSGIAQQNIRRLNLTHDRDAQLADRLTLLPLTLSDLRKRRVNFISFTPGTSLDLKGRGGTAKERGLLYILLQGVWPTAGSGAANLLQCTVRRRDRWRASLQEFQQAHDISDDLRGAFVTEVMERGRREREAGRQTLEDRYRFLCERYAHGPKSQTKQDGQDRLDFVGEMRLLLARTCIRSLEPDLVILDEFQRFKHLLSGSGEAASLARELFEYSDADTDQHVRTLLLSATPYKMYTLAHEQAEDDHYEDFLGTVAFLERSPDRMAALRQSLEGYRRSLYQLEGSGLEPLRTHKASIEMRLRRLMSRTERVGVGDQRDGMLREVRHADVRLEPDDVRSYVQVAEVAKCLEQRSISEYWKSAPYLPNLMDEYQLDKALVAAVEGGEDTRSLADALDAAPHAMLPFDRLVSYQDLETAHSQLRAFRADLERRGAFDVLWIPPSWPAWQLEGVFRHAADAGLTKRLVFSSWQVVPKALSSLLSYEAERRALKALDAEARNDAVDRKRRRGLLRFAMDGARPQAMTAFALLLPSPTLAKWGDVRGAGTGPRASRLSVEQVRELVRARIERDLAPRLARAPDQGRIDEDWYWAAPLELDVGRSRALRSWWLRENVAASWLPGGPDAGAPTTVDDPEDDDEGDADGAWKAHVALAQEHIREEVPLGRPPEDILDVLADLALGGLGACALRALACVGGRSDAVAQPVTVAAAAALAWRLRLYLNGVEAMALVRTHGRGEAYWRQALDYAIAGGLGAVLEEQVHLDRDLQGLFDEEPETALEQHVATMGEALGLRSAQVVARSLTVARRSGRIRLGQERIRTHFAVRFGRTGAEDEKQVSRDESVRASFNSPFWPLVLVSTSVGQEGLDFHPWCHAVVHWNLPPNPVDLEQREGRVHRYKGHAVRRNLVKRYGHEVEAQLGHDGWSALFERARLDAVGKDHGGLVPYWVFADRQGFAIERHLLLLPLSRESERIGLLQRSLAIYRMVFGQPRQDDLLAWLLDNVRSEVLEEARPLLQIDLAPRGLPGRTLETA
ncbi:MAG: DEAD/DEAH box helicase [Planctomycetes bacterium]|nr:DEAD/DEAH box helicase [Planctomycetota bacterium]